MFRTRSPSPAAIQYKTECSFVLYTKRNAVLYCIAADEGLRVRNVLFHEYYLNYVQLVAQ